MILSPLSAMSEIDYIDVRRKQIECLVNVLQSAGQQLTSDQWPTVIETVRVVVTGKLRSLVLQFSSFLLRHSVYLRSPKIGLHFTIYGCIVHVLLIGSS